MKTFKTEITLAKLKKNTLLGNNPPLHRVNHQNSR